MERDSSCDADSRAPRRRSGRGYLAPGGVDRDLFAEVCEEQGLVDAALEDRHAHFHALLDDLATLHAGFARELRGREMDCHRSGASCEVYHVASTVSRPLDGINNKCSIRPKHSSGVCEGQTGFGMSTQTWSTSKRRTSQSPSARIPNVSVA